MIRVCTDRIWIANLLTAFVRYQEQDGLSNGKDTKMNQLTGCGVVVKSGEDVPKKKTCFGIVWKTWKREH